MIVCQVCGRRVKAVDLLGKWWVYVHADDPNPDHYARPGKVARP